MDRLVVRVVKGPQVSWCVHEAGDFFEVENSTVRVPSGKCVCAWSLSVLLPFVSACRGGTVPVEYVHCPDPIGKVVWRIEQASSQSSSAKTC